MIKKNILNNNKAQKLLYKSEIYTKRFFYSD